VPNLVDHLSWREVLRGSGYDSPADVPEVVALRMEAAAEALFQPVRDAWGGPLEVVSALRSPEVNKACGGSSKSRHMAGDAFDLRPSKRGREPGDIYRLYRLIERLQDSGAIPAGGLAIYLKKDGGERFVHADGRGRRARWNSGHLKRATTQYKSETT